MTQLDLRAETGLPVGAHDFVAYWGAYDVAEQGGNPYDAQELAAAQSEVHPRYEGAAQRYWNPPWGLLPLLPVLALPFGAAASTWLVLQMVGGMAALLLSWRLLRPGEPRPSPLVLALGATFVPLFESLRLGQMGVLVALVVLGGLVALREEREYLAGALLALTIIKPQTVLILLLVVGIHVLATKRWKVVLSAVVTAAGVVATSWLLLPSVWQGWSPLGGSPTHWRTATLASWLREAFPAAGDAPLVVVPAFALLAALPWAFANRRSVRWDRVPLLLALSLLAAPYAWVADSTLAIPAYLLAMAALVEPLHWRDRVAGSLAIGSQLGALGLQANADGYHHMMAIPLCLAVASLILPVRRTRGADQSSPEPDDHREALVPLVPSTTTDVSIIIPAYEEEQRIPAFLDELVEYVALSERSIEVLVVDDGSQDGTTGVVASYQDRIPGLQCISLPHNRGKGCAVRTGMLAATGARRVFIDADGSIHPREIDRLLRVDAAVVISSVAAPGAELDPPQGRLRAAAGSLGNRVIQALVLPGILDSQRGCKVFTAEAAISIFDECVVDRWAFDVEALALARKLGYEPVEVGIRWAHRDGGTIRPTTYLETLRMVASIAKRVGRQPEVRPAPLRSRRIDPQTDGHPVTRPRSTVTRDSAATVTNRTEELT